MFGNNVAVYRENKTVSLTFGSYCIITIRVERVQHWNLKCIVEQYTQISDTVMYPFEDNI